jgi:predicted Zn-dependent peptidase
MTSYNTFTLDNGLLVIHLPSSSQVVYCGYQLAVGTRDELPGEEGENRQRNWLADINPLWAYP